MTQNRSDLRKKVAREAATLLYFGVEKEYKQAKLRAAKTLGAHFLPTNLEVAIELDKIAEENEGAEREKRLVKMREEALKIMRLLEAYNPVLVGSVWRGTIHHDSDIDITVYCEEPNKILEALKQAGVKVIQTERVTSTKSGEREKSFHIYVESPKKEKIELVVRSLKMAHLREKCEIYGDVVKGLSISELEEVLRGNPQKRFLPF
ncbi:MAG: nucleotidyltransferase domain-containing protein [Candidatus Bathyarchaeia archaeon]